MARLGSRKRFLEPLLCYRLQKVVERIDFECLNRVLVMGCHEYYGGHVLHADCASDFKTVHLRHLNIEEDQIRFERTDHLQRFFAVARLVNGADFLVDGQSSRSPSRASGSSSTSNTVKFMRLRGSCVESSGNHAIWQHDRRHHATRFAIHDGKLRRITVQLHQARPRIRQSDPV